MYMFKRTSSVPGNVSDTNRFNRECVYTAGSVFIIRSLFALQGPFCFKYCKTGGGTHGGSTAVGLCPGPEWARTGFVFGIVLKYFVSAAVDLSSGTMCGCNRRFSAHPCAPGPRESSPRRTAFVLVHPHTCPHTNTHTHKNNRALR